MKTDKNLILKLQHLARLALSEAAQIKLQSDLDNILKMVEKMNELDTKGLTPLIYMSEEVNLPLRQDFVANQLSTEAGVKSAPQVIDNFFTIEKVK